MGADWPFQGSLSEPQLLNYGASFHYFLKFSVWRGVEVPKKSCGRVRDNTSAIPLTDF
jgi:hypothetical protein